jgi:hypothetical protein
MNFKNLLSPSFPSLSSLPSLLALIMMTLVGVTAGWRMIAAPVEANEASKIVTAFIRREGGEPVGLSL